MSDDWNKLKHLVDLSAENARLKAEVEAYRSASDEVAAAFLALPTPHNQVARVCEGIESLKAEVERLRKAGDDLYKSMLEIGCNEMADNFQYDAWWGSMRAWQSAKEGKQP